ncbi:hypothetical protein ACFFRR_004323 [Megaselia abdita]
METYLGVFKKNSVVHKEEIPSAEGTYEDNDDDDGDQDFDFDNYEFEKICQSSADSATKKRLGDLRNIQMKQQIKITFIDTHQHLKGSLAKIAKSLKREDFHSVKQEFPDPVI